MRLSVSSETRRGLFGVIQPLLGYAGALRQLAVWLHRSLRFQERYGGIAWQHTGARRSCCRFRCGEHDLLISLGIAAGTVPRLQAITSTAPSPIRQRAKTAA